MNCKKCDHKLFENAKFCNKCGTQVQLSQGEEIKIKDNVENLKKDIVNTGKSVYAIGWVSILLNIVIYIWSIFDEGFSDSGLPSPDLAGVYVVIIFSIVFIILGARIKKLNDLNTKLYIQALLLTSLFFLIWIVATGGRVGLLFFIVILYLLSSAYSIRKLMKIDDFSSTLIHPKYKLNKRGWVIFVVVAAILFFVAVGFDSVVRNVFSDQAEVQVRQEDSDYSKVELVRKIVGSAKSQITLPMELDGVTTLVDIVAEPSVIRYEYVLHDLADADSLSNKTLRDMIKPSLCSNENLKDIMSEGINIKYSYVIQETQQTYLTIFTRGDCYSN